MRYSEAFEIFNARAREFFKTLKQHITRELDIRARVPEPKEPEWMKLAIDICERTGFVVVNMERRGGIWYCEFRAPDIEGDGREWAPVPQLLDGRWRTDRVIRMIENPSRRNFGGHFKLK